MVRDARRRRASHHEGKKQKSSPPEGGGMHGLIPELGQSIVQHRQGDRTSGHVERGHVRTDQRARDGDAVFLQDASRRIVHQIELERRRPAKAVDEKQSARPDARPSPSFTIALTIWSAICIGVGQLHPSAARLAMDADAHFHLVLAERKRRGASRRNRAARQRDADRPGPRIDVGGKLRAQSEVQCPSRRRRQRSFPRPACPQRRGGLRCRSIYRRQHRHW